MLVDTIKARKRQTSNVKYIDALQSNHSKLCVVIVDLSYKKPYSEKITLYEANKDLNRLLNNRRTKPKIFEHNVGYTIKKEFTDDKGVHLHTIFMFDGQKVQKDANKADEIGKYWNEQITKDKGTYYNCNRNQYPEHGIGMLDHTDVEKRKLLIKPNITTCRHRLIQSQERWTQPHHYHLTGAAIPTLLTTAHSRAEPPNEQKKRPLLQRSLFILIPNFQFPFPLHSRSHRISPVPSFYCDRYTKACPLQDEPHTCG